MTQPADHAAEQPRAPVFCCVLREHFLLGIIGQQQKPVPVEAVDLIVAWEPQIVLAIRFCPFCGEALAHNATRRIVQKRKD